MSIKENRFWQGIKAISHHCYDSSLSKYLVDFGCGMDTYVKH